MRKIILLLIGISIISCKNTKKENLTAASEDLEPKIILYVLDGGTIQVNKLELFSQDTTYQGQSKALLSPYYIISHPKGTLMWDAGLSESLVGLKEPYETPDGGFSMSRKDSLINQLAAIGLSIESFDYIALSHHHADHTGHANLMKNATWLVQENEFNAIAGDSAKVKDPAVKDLTKVEILNGDYDVFNDGMVVIKSMPGHTIGHQVLYLELGLEQPILLTGDLYHFEENRKNKIVPSFNYNVEQTLKSMNDFEAFAREKNAIVIIQHSSKDFNRLKELLNN
ncbi:MAG: N-acyl homoserine lactonase family protein [Maribacter sp.]|nr:N-acyl homoserine lactonase family protein [Maribacter sp.]